MSRLTVRADEVRVGDTWHDREEDVDLRCTEAARLASRPGMVRIYVQIEEDRGVKRLMRLLYCSDETLDIERPDPPTDEEHEAALRERLATREVWAADEGAPIAAVLRLLDAERAKAKLTEGGYCPTCSQYIYWDPSGPLDGAISRGEVS